MSDDDSRRYRRLTMAAKQALHRERMREPAIACPYCEAHTVVAELLRHVESTCPGHRPAHPLSKWISWDEAMALGVPKQTLCRWVVLGYVQSYGEIGARRYLLRDLVKMLARRIGPRDGTGKR